MNQRSTRWRVGLLAALVASVLAACASGHATVAGTTNGTSTSTGSGNGNGNGASTTLAPATASTAPARSTSTGSATTTTSRPAPAHSTSTAAVVQTKAVAPLRSLPTETTVSLPPGPTSPPPVVGPMANGALPVLPSPRTGTGPWQPAGDATDAGYPIYVAEMTVGGGVPPAVLAWINHEATRLVLYAGISEPPGPWADKSAVPPALQPELLAAFNGGFMINDYRTGWYKDGTTAMPLQPGAASLVIGTNGSVNVGQWGRDVGPGSEVQAVRQNLPLLVDNSAPVAGAGAPAAWGATIGGVAATWRSGIGVTATGDLVYVGGPSLTPLALAQLLVAGGSVRAMQLDINPDWVSFATYTHVGDTLPGPITQGYNALPGMNFAPGHYLQPFSRDFFAIFAR